jgi:hypothetical protein
MSFAFAGLMNTRSYFTNLIASDASYPVDYDAAHLENMELPAFYGVGQPDDTPPPDVFAPLDDGHVAGKVKKKEPRISMLKRINSWCHHGLMYHKMQYKELIKQKAPTGAEFISTSMQPRHLIQIALKYLS